MFHKLTGMIAVAAACAFAQPPFAGTIFDFPDSFKDSDPTTLTTVTYVGQQQKNVFDRRAGNININAYVFTAAFNDGANTCAMMVNPEFSLTEAKALAEKYARNIGQMPMCIRSGLTGAVIHDGNNPWGGGNPLTIHHGQGLNYERQGIVTETMIHEASHAIFDRVFYTKDWYDTAKADGEYISTYARDYPGREDHSETFLCWLVARYKKDRIPATHFTKITATVPNRMKYYDGKNFNLSPVVGGTTAAFGDGLPPSAPYGSLTNFYNPFRSEITIGYQVEKPSRISLQILDMQGRIIRTLAQEQAGLGRHWKIWDTFNDAGQRVPGGAYVSRLIAGESPEFQSMVLSR
jgi:hypothetical protein